MACVASPLAPDSPSCLHDDVAALYGEAQKLYADAQQDVNGDDAPAAWDLPEAMLTGGMPQGFENTRRDVGSLTMKIANKKADIEALLERMAKLQSRYKNMTEGKEEMSRTVKKAARKSPLPQCCLGRSLHGSLGGNQQRPPDHEVRLPLSSTAEDAENMLTRWNPQGP